MRPYNCVRLGLAKDLPLRFGTDAGAAWDSHIPLLHPDDHEETRRVWSTCLSTGCAGEVSFRVRDAQGNYRWFLSRAEPLGATDGTVQYWIGINLDIEERKQAEFYLAEGQRIAHTGSWAFSPAVSTTGLPSCSGSMASTPAARRQRSRNTWRSYTRTIGSSSRRKFRRCWQSIADSTSRNGLCDPMERFVMFGASVRLRLRGEGPGTRRDRHGRDGRGGTNDGTAEERG